MEFKEVFEPVLNFIKNLQKKDKEAASKQAAKDRLKLVLMQDRASVSPDFFELMKKEIIDVIKKYIEIDEESLEVQLTRGLEAGLEGPALYANIPIKNVKPVAPQNEDDLDSNNEVMTEEKAEQYAEQILSQIEEAAASEKVENEENNEQQEENKEEEKIEAEESVLEKEAVEAKKEVEEKKKVTTRKTTKTTDKAKTTKKTTTAKKTSTTKSKK